VHVAVEPHEYFVRSGYDLVCELPVSVTQAVLGAEVMLDTLDDTITITIEPGTASGHRTVLRRQGVPYVDGRGRGDLVVEVVVEIPTDLDDEQEALMRQLAALRGEDVAEPRAGLISRVRSALR
jgi:molecular chaperone DnaJ